MYNQKTRILCYAFTLLPALVGLVLWQTSPAVRAVFPAGLLLTPVVMAGVLALCLYVSGKLDKDHEKNKKINSVVIWLIPVLSNFTFWLSYGLIFRGAELPMLRLESWLFAGMYLVLGNYLPKCRQNSTVGIRVKWTASTEENWNATHRLAGPCYMICGFLMVPASFLPEKAAMVCLIALLVLGNAIPLVYSYAFYRRQQRQGIAFQPRPKWESTVNKVVLAIVGAILVCTALFLCTGSVKYRFSDTAVQVDVTYYGSTVISYDDIADAELRSGNVPGTRVWGLGSFRLLAGLFENDEFGSYTRMTYYDPDSAIVLETVKGQTYVLSGRNPADTAAIYAQLTEHIS